MSKGKRGKAMIAKPSDHAFERFHRLHFHALHTNVDLLIRAESDEIAVIERMSIEWFREAEARFSRKLPDSELNLLNTLAGERCKVSDRMLEVLALAETYRRITHSAYNPLITPPAAVAELPADTAAPLADAVIPPSAEHVFLDSDTKSVRLPNEAQLDLDSIVQNWILQRLADLLQHRLKLKQGILQVGGSHQVWRRPTENFDPWLLEIHKPGQELEVIASLSMSEGAAVTYTVEAQENGSGVKQITVTGNDIVECGIWAQAISKLGIEAGLSLLAGQAAHCEALLLASDDKLHFYGNKASLGTKWSEIKIDYYH
jgi:thiamine biosynthesis lipoprotein